ncbi:MAG: SBBP repeat-containing protein [Candidatus Binataceae bacterium]
MTVALAILIGAATSSRAAAQAPPRHSINSIQARASAAKYASLPIAFEPNQGQASPRVKYLSRGQGYTLMLGADAATLVMTQAPAAAPMVAGVSPEPGRKALIPKVESRSIRMRLLGANPASRIDGLNKLAGQSNYLIGNDPTKWRTRIPNYAQVRYSSVYPGIDLVYYGTQGRLEYDLRVAPRANAGAIEFAIDGADRMELNAAGDLMIRAGEYEIALRKPIAYQMEGGRRQEIASRFVRGANSTVGFAIARYDRDKPLIIDPGLVYSTYFGGVVTALRGLAVDSSGSAYIAGWTGVVGDLPTTSGVLQPSLNPGGPSNGLDAFVTKLTPDGSGLVYSTYLGGSKVDEGLAIAVDTSGNAYVAGLTLSNDFPRVKTNSTLQTGLNSSFGNAFVAELNSTGSGLVFSTFLGGSVADFAEAVTLDAAGNVYVAGLADSPDFPTTASAYQPNDPSTQPANEGFVAKLSVSGELVGLAYSTYLGAPNNPPAAISGANLLGIAADSSGNAYVTGDADENFPTTTGPAYGGSGDAVVARIDTTKSGAASLVYARYLGGSGEDIGVGIAISPVCTANCDAYVAGQTNSADFPSTSGAYQTTYGGGTDGFVAEVDSGGATVFATYLGGPGGDTSETVAVDAVGNVYVGGWSDYYGFPTVNPVQPLATSVGQVIAATNGGTTYGLANWTGTGVITTAVDTSVTPGTLYVGTFANGLWKSVDGGNSFSPTGITSGPVNSVAVTGFITPARLYVGTNGNVQVSVDGGQNFTPATGITPGGIIARIIPGDAGHSSTVFACSGTGLFRSTDFGQTFGQVSGIPAGVEVYDGVANGQGDFFAATAQGVYESTNGEVNSEKLGLTFSLTNVNWASVYALAADTVSSPPIVYAGTHGNGIVASTDGFNNNLTFGSIPFGIFQYVYSLAVDNSSATTPLPVIAGMDVFDLYAGDMIRSTDGGQTYQQILDTFGGDPVGISIESRTSPSTMYAALFQGYDGTLTELSPDGSRVLFSTFLGGTGRDFLEQVVLDKNANPYVAGLTWSTDFPTAGSPPGAPYQSALNGFENGFIAKFPNSQPGANVTVAPSTTTSVSFGTATASGSLTSSGETTVSTTTTGPPPPTGFNFAGTYYDFTTDASHTGNLTVCIDYVPADFTDPGSLVLFHYSGGAWNNVTSSNDSVNGVICGVVSSLSPFALGTQFEPLSKTNCKEGQWEQWRSPAFKNQGQCISFVNHNG